MHLGYLSRSQCELLNHKPLYPASEVKRGMQDINIYGFTSFIIRLAMALQETAGGR